jgi:hypothetical protein
MSTTNGEPTRAAGNKAASILPEMSFQTITVVLPLDSVFGRFAENSYTNHADADSSTAIAPKSPVKGSKQPKIAVSTLNRSTPDYSSGSKYFE